MSAETSSADAAPADDPPAGSDRPSLVRFDYSRFSADELRLVTSPSALLSTFGVLRHLLPLRSNGCLVHPCATRSIRLDEVIGVYFALGRMRVFVFLVWGDFFLDMKWRTRFLK